ncbi:MAG TPA: hypothetical protein VFZ81_04785, partial [Burkholderiales bacterium]
MPKPLEAPVMTMTLSMAVREQAAFPGTRGAGAFRSGMPSITPEIIFHDVDRSQWVESYIAERADRLER